MIVAGFSLGRNSTRWALLAAINNRTIWPRSRSRPEKGKEEQGAGSREPREGADPQDRPFVHLSLAFNPRTAVAANRFGVS